MAIVSKPLSPKDDSKWEDVFGIEVETECPTCHRRNKVRVKKEFINKMDHVTEYVCANTVGVLMLCKVDLPILTAMAEKDVEIATLRARVEELEASLEAAQKAADAAWAPIADREQEVIAVWNGAIEVAACLVPVLMVGSEGPEFRLKLADAIRGMKKTSNDVAALLKERGGK